MPERDARSLRVARAAAQLLHRPGAAGPAELVRRLLGVQAQDLRAARLALRARAPELTAADVDAALIDERSVVVGWLARGTLHLAASEDYPWLLALTAPPRFATSRRRLGQEGVPPDDADRAVAIIERSLASEGPLERPELAERIAAEGVRTEGQALPHLLMLAALRGVTVLGPVRHGRQAFVLTRDWLGAEAPVPLDGEARDAALAEIARRYLAAHGPATAADLAAWAGSPLRDARAGLRSIGSELIDGGEGLVDLASREPAPVRIPPRLLPAYDPYLLGWKDRSFAVPTKEARRVHPGGGLLRPTATVDGLAVGTWSLRRDGDRLSVDVDLFGSLERADSAALQADAEDVARFAGTQDG